MPGEDDTGQRLLAHGSQTSSDTRAGVMQFQAMPFRPKWKSFGIAYTQLRR